MLTESNDKSQNKKINIDKQINYQLTRLELHNCLINRKLNFHNILISDRIFTKEVKLNLSKEKLIG